MTNNDLIKKSQRAASWGLYGSIAVAIATMAFYFFSSFRFYLDNHSFRWIMAAGCLLAVAVIAIVLLGTRRLPKDMRQYKTLNDKVGVYYQYIVSVYRTTLVVVVAECVIITILHDNTLLMLVILLVLLLMFNYPNMLRYKVCLSLSDDEMTQLFPNYLAYVGKDQQSAANNSQTPSNKETPKPNE